MLDGHIDGRDQDESGVTHSMRRPARVYWTAFIGLLFNYYDLYLFVYLEKPLATEFGLTSTASDALQLVGLAGAGVGALGFGWLADLFGRGRTMLTVFCVYVAGLAGLSLAGDYATLLSFRLLTSLALGAEWGISHTYVWERVDRDTRYRFSALLQFALLGGLLAAFARNYLLSVWGWRGLFAASILPVVVLSAARWRVLAADTARPEPRRALRTSPDESPARPLDGSLRSGMSALRDNAAAFAVCFGIASMTIASGTINVFYAKDLPQSGIYTTLFWLNVIPGMLLGAWIVRRLGVGRTLAGYALVLIALSVWAWFSTWPQRTLAFALVLPLLNGLPFGLMGAFFNEVFGEYRTMLSGAAYNLGRILAGFSPALITLLGLHEGSNYFLFTAALGAGTLALAPRASRLLAGL
jgi:predicted MFS family arabinose efflux permease